MAGPNEQITEIVAQGEEERAMVAEAKVVYVERGNPEPVEEKVTFGKLLAKYGPESIFQIISLFGAAYVSSLRVGILMEITQLNLIATYLINYADVTFTGSAVSMRWASMAAFEGALLAGGFIIGSRLLERKHDKWVDYTALTVTIVGGALSSFTLIPNAQTLATFIAWVFAFVSSVGAPFIVIFMAANAGFLWKEIIGLQKKFHEEWLKIHDEWSKGFNSEYPYIAAQLFGVERRRKLTKFDDKVPPNPEESNGSGLTERVRQYLREAGIRPSQVGDGPEFRMKGIDIANELGLQGNERESIRQSMSRLRKEERLGKWN